MDPLRNPYTPNAGATPPALFGREAQIEGFSLLLARLSHGYTEKSMIVTGLRGVGKPEAPADPGRSDFVVTFRTIHDAQSASLHEEHGL